jgi:hypothetical protein
MFTTLTIVQVLSCGVGCGVRDAADVQSSALNAFYVFIRFWDLGP